MNQLPLYHPKLDWRPTPVSELPRWPERGRVSIDTETRDPDLRRLGPGVRRGAYIVGYSFAIEDGPKHYVPIRHQGGGNVDAVQAVAYLQAQAGAFCGTLVGGNMQYDLDFLAEEGVEFRRAEWFRDVQVAEPLLDDLQFTYGLDDILVRHGFPPKSEDVLRDAASAYGLDPKTDLWQFPAAAVGVYGEDDAAKLLPLLRKQERRIDEENLWGVWDLESRVLPVLLRMRRRGVRVNLQTLEQIETWADSEGTESLRAVRDMTGVQLSLEDMNNSNALAKVLLAIGVKVPVAVTTKGKTNYSVDAALLASVHHEAAKKLAWAKKMRNLRCKFANSVRQHEIRGRIHTTFNQLRREKEDGDSTGAAFGRLSSTDPNLQQQPARDPEIGKRWRAIYEPEEGMLWAACDYSQQEPRMLVHFAEIKGFPGADIAAGRYRDDPKTDNHTMMAQIIAGEGPDWKPSKRERDDAKQTFLGLCYGMGGGKLCKKLGRPTQQAFSKRLGRNIEVAGAEGQAILDAFDRGVPFVRQMARRCEEVARSRGYIRTIAGRRCRFPAKTGGGFDWTHKALNRLIQGSSADQTKQALVDVDAAGHYLQLQVHDEVDLSVRDESEGQQVARLMCEGIKLRVPSKVDVDLGKSWGEAM